MEPTAPTESCSPFDDGELYDAILHDFSYGSDFYLGLAKEADGPVLDIGCGTGRILLPCLQAGVDVDGLDLFEPMLSRLRQKAEALQLSPPFRLNLFRANAPLDEAAQKAAQRPKTAIGSGKACNLGRS